MSEKKLSIGLIGLGYWGKNIARNLSDMGVLSAIYDNNNNTIEKFSKIYHNARSFNDLTAFFKNNMDAVFIATPASTHGLLVKKSLDKGLHVFVEKPLCLNVKEAEKLKNIADKNKLKLMVGHLLLYHPAFEALKNIFTSGILGKIRYIYSNRLSLGKLRKEENALWSFAPHDISMILSLLQSEPININAYGGYYLTDNVADTTMTLMEFDNGVKAHVFVSWLHPYKDQRLIVVGEKAMVTFIDVEEKKKKLMLYKHDVAWDKNIPVVEKAEGKIIEFDYEKEPLREECKSFIKWINYNIVPPSDAAEGIRVLKVLDKAEKELRKNKLND